MTALEWFTYRDDTGDPERGRQARLLAGFGLLGFALGVLYAGFYACIGHRWGAGIVAVCSVGFAAVPFALRAGVPHRMMGHGLAGLMAAGFSGLACVEGGLRGHAVAWLATVPLCALLLVGRMSALAWGVLCFLACLGFVIAEAAGVRLPTTYDATWHLPVTALGYLGLVGFMVVLGLIVERGRVWAFERMREAQVRLETSNEKLAAMNFEKNEFLGIAAHDLKNPLTAIIGSAQLLGMDPAPGDVLRLAANIDAAGSRMQHLITDLLDANAIEEGRFTSRLESCDLHELAGESLLHHRTNADRKQIALSLAPGESVWSLTDRVATLQILDNLVSNAVKYSPWGSEVLITVAAAGTQGTVSVTDQGPGLTEGDQARLFQKFTRLSARPTGGESSTGLGLAIVKRLAEALSGSVECRSRPGAGATFILRLPAAEPKAS